MATIGIVCGLQSEIRALGPWAQDPRVHMAVSGADPKQAEKAARLMAAEGCAHLISWGLAGGLAADVPSGAVIQPGAVILPHGGRLEITRGMASDVAIVGSDTVVTGLDDKQTLRAKTGAIAVDMESHRLAEVCVETGVGLAVVRAVSDPVGRALPALAASAVGPDGKPKIGRVLAGLARRPWDLPDLIRAGRDSNRALAALRAFALATSLDDVIARAA